MRSIITPTAVSFDRTGNHEGRDGTGENLGVAEYTLLEKAHVLGGGLDGWDVLYPKVQQVDLLTRVRAETAGAAG